MSIAIRALLTSLILAAAFFGLGFLMQKSEDASDAKWLRIATLGFIASATAALILLIAIVWLT